MTDILQRICQDKRVHIAASKVRMPETALLDKAHAAAVPRGFMRALKQRIDAGGIGLIAEIKKASPSKGVIRADFYPAQLAEAYAAGGATCLSVLTDIPYFQGDDTYLVEARQAVDLPVLRKDFMLDPYQVVEARALGADCILLIMACLSDMQARELEEAAQRLGMDVLIEVHEEEELARACTQLTSPLIGINNRNLKTLAIDLATSERLVRAIPAEKRMNGVVVCESGIETLADIRRMRASNMHAFLIGESLMRQDDVTKATALLLHG